ncbi:MAG: acyltransferase [Oscillospiraceae bacterium]|nr:acyltransferase [Oscillospiraceae bacterium]
MDKRLDALNEDLKKLLLEVGRLNDALHCYTKQTYNRINPLNENLIDWKEKGKLISGYDNTTIYESCTIIGDVALGDNCWVGPFTILDGGGGLTIGASVTIAAGAMIYTHDTLKHTLSNGKAPYDYRPVVIEDNCFIGSQAIILKGSHIGHHSLISANALVRGDVPPYSIVAGSPATIVGKIQVEGDAVTLVYHEEDK